jgi:predicted alpha-1,2-mannosidase
MLRPRVTRKLFTGGLITTMLTAMLSATFMATGDPASAATLNLTQYVNPLIGTDDSNSPNPVGGGAGGSTYPGATVPFGMVQFSPDTPTASPSGYRDRDRTINDFSLTHFNGAGCSNNDDLQLAPITGAIGASPGTNWTDYSSTYTKSNESAAPGYYKNHLDTYNTDVELSATTRTGVAKLGFPSTNQARLLINTSRSATGSRSGSISISGSTVTGSLTAGGFCGSSKTYPIYFAIKFDRAPTGFGTWNGGTVSAGSSSTSGVNTGGYVTFDTTGGAAVTANVALSFVSGANASANLTAETASFATVRSSADTAWNTALNRIQATGGSAADEQKFYTALYHVFENPNVSSDVNGQYRGFDNAIHSATFPVYQNYSGWDIYRSWSALVALIAPDVSSDIMKSMILDGQQGGLLPKWSQQTNEDFIMTGDPGPIIVASAYAFGARDFDTAAALTLMKKSASGGTTQGSAIRGNESTYEANHFIPGAPSDSLEYSASDFAIAQFAKAQGDTSTYNSAMARAQYWRSSFNTESSYIHPRNSDGSWPWPLNPATQSPFTEGTAAQYTWMVPQNFSALINLMGGPAQTTQRLDQHFTALNGGTDTANFYIGNEPEHGVPWVYNFVGKPSSTSDVVRRVMAQEYTTGAGGLPGNDDLGATSAWYVWAALGMYPATPGADTLALHGPLFPSITIARTAGNIQINGGSASSEYVQSLTLNGSSEGHNWLQYGDLAAGATLNYTMGTSPSIWGTAASDEPPSFTDGASQPATPPDLGTNLALNKTVTGSTACASTESAANAVDGSLNTKWCSLTASPSLTVDLGSTQTVASFVLDHAGLGGENTGWNTGAFTISTSTDNTNWTPAVSVSGSRSSRTYHPIVARSARYVRLNVTTPTNNGDTATRIYEFGVYAQGGASSGAGIIKGQESGRCVDVPGGNQANGTRPALWDCNGGTNQAWTWTASNQLMVFGTKCLDANGNGSADGTIVQIYDCNGSSAQQWSVNADGTIVGIGSGKCLDATGHGTANGTLLELWTCNGGANQKWSRS